MPPLNGLKIFEAAARHQSFVRAAEELHLTHGAVSRQIKQLEMQLQVELFDRRNRAVFLTRQGTILFEACAEVMGTLAEAIRKIRRPPSKKAPLVLSCEPTIAIRWLIPRLPEFRVRHPEHSLHLLTAGGHVDFAGDRIDVAFRRNDFQWSAPCHAERVASEATGPVCSPSQAEALRAGGAHSRAPRLLHSRSRPTAWQRWQALSGKALNVAGAEHFEHFYLSLQAASAGLGVAIGSVYMVEDDLRDGRLVAPFEFVPDGSDYMLLSPTPFQDDERRGVLLEWLRDEMAKSRQRMDLLLGAAGTTA